jgi:hypothetical protein
MREQCFFLLDSLSESAEYGCCQIIILTIYLARVLCLSVCDCVCVSQFVSERSAILLVLIIKLTKASRRRVWRGRDRDGEIWKGTDRRGRV